MLYSGAGKGRCGHLRRLASPEDVQGNALDRQASHLLQYLALEAHPRSKLAASAIHAGPGELPFGANRRQRADLTLVVDWGRLLVVNYHGGFWHYHGHFPSCPAFDASLPAAVNAETLRADAFKAGYARALNAVEGAPASFAYRAYAECDFFHGSRTFRARRSGVEYAELRDLLQAEHPRDAVLGIGRASWRADDLVAAIDAGKAHGFVAVAGGRETARDKVSHLYSFVPQRSTVRRDELGEATLRQVEVLHGAGTPQAERALKNYTSRHFTLTKSYADLEGAGVVVLGTSLFRWLRSARGFRDFELRHFLAYEHRDYLAPYLLGALRERQAEKAKPGGGSPLLCEALKLLTNSYYGFLGLQASNYTRTRVSREGGLLRSGPDTLRRLQSLALLGCAPVRRNKRDRERRRARAQRQALEAERRRAAGGGGDDEERGGSSGNDDDDDDDDHDDGELELVYAATLSNPKAKIRNLLQVSAAILGISKRIYLGHVHFLLDHLSSKEVEQCYFDTDSCLLACHRYRLEDMVAFGKEDAFRRGLPDVLWTPDSGRDPFGLFKYDARATRGLFHSPKCYLLRGGDDPDGGDDDDDAGDAGPVMKRFKGCSRDVQQALDARHFALALETGLSRPAFANRTRLGPTAGFQMLLSDESRRLVAPVSLKRRYDVGAAARGRFRTRPAPRPQRRLFTLSFRSCLTVARCSARGDGAAPALRLPGHRNRSCRAPRAERARKRRAPRQQRRQRRQPQQRPRARRRRRHGRLRRRAQRRPGSRASSLFFPRGRGHAAAAAGPHPHPGQTAQPLLRPRALLLVATRQRQPGGRRCPAPPARAVFAEPGRRLAEEARAPPAPSASPR